MKTPDDKVLSLKKILPIIQQEKKAKRKIVTYNGSFDIIHVGHVLSIQEAKKQGDILIILLNSDASIKRYKGPTRPIIGEKERAAMVAAIEGVDYVILFDEINPKNVLSEIKPDIHCNGSDWGRNCIERETVEKNGGKIHVLKWQQGFSTTSLIKKIFATENKPVFKAVFIDRDDTITKDSPYWHKAEELKFLPGAIKALQKLSNTEYKIIIVTNQSGIGRGYFTQKDFEKLTTEMKRILHQHKVRVDNVYYCPHNPDEGCECRKPSVGLLLQAVNEFGISLNDSWMIGDRDTDVIAGREANVKTIKIGKHMPKELKLEPNYYAADLLEAVKIIVK